MFNSPLIRDPKPTFLGVKTWQPRGEGFSNPLAATRNPGLPPAATLKANPVDLTSVPTRGENGEFHRTGETGPLVVVGGLNVVLERGGFITVFVYTMRT